MLKRILFIGLGGAGQRHLRLFKKNLVGQEVEFIAYRSTNKTPLLNPDFSVNLKDSLESLYGVKIYHDFERALKLKPDLAVISTPSSMHINYAQLCAERGINILVEKPLSNSTKGLDKLKKTIKKNKVNLRVGLQRRFHPHLIKVNQIIKSGEIGNILKANFTVASYIPRWHPYEDFRELYACRKELGGGVLLTEIHEIDLAVWYFGAPYSVVCVGGTYSNAGIDVEDTVKLTLNYIKFSVQINLTFWQKNHERFFSISGDDGYLCWNQEEDTLKEEYLKAPNKNLVLKNPRPNIDAMFDAQIKSIIDKKFNLSSVVGIDDAWVALKIVEAAKKSMNTKSVVVLSGEEIR